MTTAVSANQDGVDAEESLNIQEFLSFIESKIKNMASETVDHTDIESKSGLDILADLEHILDEQLQNIRDINTLGPAAQKIVFDLETQQRKDAIVAKKAQF